MSKVIPSVSALIWGGEVERKKGEEELALKIILGCE
jgi:hypothetical protein